MQYQQHQQQQPPPPPPQQQHFMPQQPLLSGFPVPLTPNYPLQLARQPTPTRTTGVTSFNQHQSTPGSGGGGDTGPPLVVFPPSTDRLSVGNDADDDQSIPSLQSLPSDESPKQTQSECVHESMWDYFKECLSWEGQSFHFIAFSVTYSITYVHVQLLSFHLQMQHPCYKTTCVQRPFPQPQLLAIYAVCLLPFSFTTSVQHLTCRCSIRRETVELDKWEADLILCTQWHCSPQLPRPAVNDATEPPTSSGEDLDHNGLLTR